ncbi:class I SAM-dependent methyltransferase [Nocardioides sp. zg-1308]|uniref:class I SAM-dependent methyltransferase n=1 Tax=Nocardioides TaxID=1839 RepID=UPI0015572DD4|nr:MULTISPECIES: class I SAM-dependent methyltransferase [unclassified Nocardioides]NPD06390.1 class I SAM-dependent methyltransferase [Nocardioides sp. zg-1308]WQQ24139.1 class I SAM-dependent methyltransferase [Nocardioides sp. S-34]
MTACQPAGFEATWDVASAIPGWLTEDQARLLFDTAQELPERPLIVEIGSHQGKSTVVLATAARALQGRVVAVDPFVEGRLFGGVTTRTKFERNVAETGLADTVELVADYSTRARPGWTRGIDYLYIDGKHDYWTLTDDLKWAAHLPVGAPILVHDCYSSIGVTLGVLAHVLPSRRLRYERRAGSMALFRVGAPSAADRWRILQEVPWWLRNVAVKVLLRLRLRPLARRLFGHESPYDPY